MLTQSATLCLFIGKLVYVLVMGPGNGVEDRILFGFWYEILANQT